MATKWDIVDAKGKIVEGGFFSRDAAIEVQKQDHPGCAVKKHK